MADVSAEPRISIGVSAAKQIAQRIADYAGVLKAQGHVAAASDANEDAVGLWNRAEAAERHVKGIHAVE